MPGIVGLVTRIPRVAAEQQLLRMLGTIRHGPSYVTGTWMNESLGVYLGWTARKDSFSDGMPLTNERGDVVLVFSGEDYPDPGSVCLLKKQGHEFQTGNASYLVHLSEEDLAFPACLNGRFHLVVSSPGRTLAGSDPDRSQDDRRHDDQLPRGLVVTHSDV